MSGETSEIEFGPRGPLDLQLARLFFGAAMLFRFSTRVTSRSRSSTQPTSLKLAILISPAVPVPRLGL
jgi:hypothetical protein